jgi:hypothetical protein
MCYSRFPILMDDMRIWSIHPAYLDAKGLVALWRETLLARAVLEGKTKGYRNHPQLDRFKAAFDPVACVDAYLRAVYEEAVRRGYAFDGGKLRGDGASPWLSVTRGQLAFEFGHLLGKLASRDVGRFERMKVLGDIRPHPLFYVVEGGVADWEKTDKPM